MMYSLDKLQSIICEYFLIHLKSMQLKLVNESHVNNISQCFDFNISMEKPSFLDELKFLYGHLLQNIDEQMGFQCSMTPLEIFLGHHDFLLIMKVLNANVSYDDACDQYIL